MLITCLIVNTNIAFRIESGRVNVSKLEKLFFLLVTILVSFVSRK